MESSKSESDVKTTAEKLVIDKHYRLLDEGTKVEKYTFIDNKYKVNHADVDAATYVDYMRRRLAEEKEHNKEYGVVSNFVRFVDNLLNTPVDLMGESYSIAKKNANNLKQYE